MPARLSKLLGTIIMISVTLRAVIIIYRRLPGVLILCAVILVLLLIILGLIIGGFFLISSILRLIIGSFFLISSILWLFRGNLRIAVKFLGITCTGVVPTPLSICTHALIPFLQLKM
jgi:hypothetical protein